MTIVIPMAGLSSRFAKAGFTLPKYMLYVKDRSLFNLSVSSFSKYFNSCEFVFIARDVYDTPRFIDEECKLLGIKKFQVVVTEPTRGQSETVIKGTEGADIPSSVNVMRDEMFKNPFSCGVFIGGMDGIIDEAKRFREANPKSDMIVVPNTGGASTVLSERTNLDFIVLPDTYAYVFEFKELLKKYQDVI